MGHPSRTPVPPEALASWLEVPLAPVSWGQYGLYEDRLQYLDTIPRELQQYQIARGACAVLLRRMGLLRHVSAHALAVELCGVSAADPQTQRERPTLRPVVSLSGHRARRRSGWLPTG